MDKKTVANFENYLYFCILVTKNDGLMRSPELEAFILKHSDLFWYTPQDKKLEISDEYLVENILNYGTLEDIRELRQLYGLQKLSDLFMNLEGRKKMNIYPEIYNYFYLYFNNYAQRDSK